ncbi:MAG: hypothetical protein JNL74_17365, partial [Fibrobacteres bacterium]|nr:hypothetical protein [Fibrobacterota bacterium]
KNVIVLKSDGTDFVNCTGDYNVSEDNTAPGANSLNTLDPFLIIKDTARAAPDLRLKGTSVAKNAGDSVGLSALYNNAINNATRQYGAWDIGADEITIHPMTWVGLGADNNWSTVANWAGGSAPTSSDTAFFDSASVKQSVVDAGYGGTVKGIHLGVGYTDTVKLARKLTVTNYFVMESGTTARFTPQTDSLQINVAALWRLLGGQFLPGTGTVFVYGPAVSASCTLRVSTGHKFYNFELRMGNSHYFNTYGNMFIENNLTLTSGGFGGDHADTIEVRGNVNSTGNTGGGGGYLYFTGPNAQTLSCPDIGRIPGIVINKSGGTLSLQDTIRPQGLWNHIAGTVNPGTSTVYINNVGSMNSNISTAGMSFYNLRVMGGWSVNINTNIDVDNDFSIENNGGYAINVNDKNITVGGNWTNEGNYVATTGTVTFDGSGISNVVTGGIGASQDFVSVTVNKTGAGKVVLRTNDLKVTSGLNITQGILDQGSASGIITGGAVTIGASGKLINRGTGYDSLGGNLTNDGLVYLNGGGYVAGETNIAVHSTAVGVDRTWSGTGTYFLTDVDIKNQVLSSGTIKMKSSTITGVCTGFDTTTHVTSSLSIGTSTSAIKSAGTATVAATDSVVTFAGVTLDDSIGEGDRIIFDVNGSSYGPDTLYIKSRDNAGQVTLQIVSPLAYTAEDYQIKRTFNDLGPWESATDADLVAQKVVKKGVCYNDGVFTTQLLIDGSTCDANHYRWVTVAVGNRHNGKAYSTAGARVEECGYHAVVDNRDQYTIIEWLQVRACDLGSGISNTGGGSGDVTVVRNCIVYTYLQSSSGNPGIG